MAELREAGVEVARGFDDGRASQSRDWSGALVRLRRVLTTIQARRTLVEGWSLLGELRRSEWCRSGGVWGVNSDREVSVWERDNEERESDFFFCDVLKQ